MNLNTSRSKPLPPTPFRAMLRLERRISQRHGQRRWQLLQRVGPVRRRSMEVHMLAEGAVSSRRAPLLPHIPCEAAISIQCSGSSPERRQTADARERRRGSPNTITSPSDTAGEKLPPQ